MKTLEITSKDCVRVSLHGIAIWHLSDDEFSQFSHHHRRWLSRLKNSILLSFEINLQQRQ
jgi:hypothetical protein